MTDVAVDLGLHAVVVTVRENVPLVLTLPAGTGRASLPFGPFDPAQHRTMEAGLRDWVSQQASLALGYVEQLYTFGDRGRLAAGESDGRHTVAVGYLALTHHDAAPHYDGRTDWRAWYDHFPWEDWRGGSPPMLEEALLPAMQRWVDAAPDTVSPGGLTRSARFVLAFGNSRDGWDDERVLERYELMYEAGLVDEARRDGLAAADGSPTFGVAMAQDHRRILATALARLRAKLKYRPLVFELLPDVFTLTRLQRTVEALTGRTLHTQNFRRLVERAELVESTGTTEADTGGRPAANYRFRRTVRGERPAPGLRIGARG
ncbi:NAD regulator [Rhizobiaceae bacterium]|nr:NAD regulator [Rhizobiaceae bacterium]